MWLAWRHGADGLREHNLPGLPTYEVREADGVVVIGVDHEARLCRGLATPIRRHVEPHARFQRVLPRWYRRAHEGSMMREVAGRGREMQHPIGESGILRRAIRPTPEIGGKCQRHSRDTRRKCR